jgi:hypothetical protein
MDRSRENIDTQHFYSIIEKFLKGFKKPSAKKGRTLIKCLTSLSQIESEQLVLCLEDYAIKRREVDFQFEFLFLLGYLSEKSSFLSSTILCEKLPDLVAETIANVDDRDKYFIPLCTLRESWEHKINDYQLEKIDGEIKRFYPHYKPRLYPKIRKLRF